MRGPGDPPRTVIDLPQLPKLPKLPVAGLRLVLLGVVALALVSTSVFTIDPEEVGVLLRFGKYVRTVEPGLHFKLPVGLERVIKVPVQRQLKQEFGYRTMEVGIRSEKDRRGYGAQSNMLTGDLNTVVVEWVVQYRVVDPFKFLFRVRRVEQTFGDISEAVMRSVVGDRTVNEVLTVGRQEVEDLVKVQLQGLADQYETGLRVEQVVLQDVNPPDPVKPSFNEVNQAEQEKQQLINEAQSEYNKAVPRAQGEALQAIQQAEGYALDRVNRAEGDAARFESIFTEYRKAPEVTRRRIYLETMNAILPKVGTKIVLDDDLQGVLPLLDLKGVGGAGGGG